ncbi:CRISPR-associated endonuclease Cas2 [Bremerella cremea]|uniref:CRISPR-associated endoribonuclease Cas2 n=1 Tax=Blastopirellula marina TaxID=124 RepID=A0A2S8FDH5_9BACT|nr:MULTISPECIES: CRISPR-associated endonuclease Cas2 [Pirellulaceae]PQO30215.1 CRISPR-associated endonuclease Cas2 [Blastopirellula marina]RCS43566.1 CRISPR-associated endonuclease Cas2 [Bremerella cremea]
MYVLVTYDVNTETREGRRRLRQIAKTCLDYGQRVQQSVFELKVDPAQWAECKAKLTGIMDTTKDSLRFYYLGANWKRRVEHCGANPSLDIDGPLIA